MTSAIIRFLACLALLLVSARTNAADESLAARAKVMLKTHCQQCHGSASPAKGGFNYVLDGAKLVARQKVIPGNANESEIYERIRDGSMPPQSRKSRPTPAEVATLKQWIEAGAPALEAAPPPSSLASERDVLLAILADLQAARPRERRFLRYLTLAHLASAGVPEPELETLRLALAKLLNCLSWHPRIARTVAIDAARTILRIDLRELQWNARLWDRAVSLTPYRLASPASLTKTLAGATGSELPYLRADWFVATAARAPLYYELLQLPTNDRDLERQLRVEVLSNVDDGSAMRAGFNDSGVSRNNRILERHDAVTGAYWRSYDFSDNLDRQNIFDHPLGPTPGRNSFVHAGGEIIFNLPNGLHAYLLVDGNGRRVDRAPVEIVSDPKRPDRIVEAGLSCMSCHAGGLHPKADQVRAHVEKNPQTFTPADVEAVRALYAPQARFRRLLARDTERYLKALAQTGVSEKDPEPVATAALRYESTLDLPLAAAELGLVPEEFTKRLRTSPLLNRLLGPLLVPGGTVQRDVFLASFPDLVRELRLGDELGAQAAGELTLGSGDKPGPFAGHRGHVMSLAFSADGRRALSGSEDQSVRLWDIASGSTLRVFEGHTEEVLAVAFSPDGRRALSGGKDRKVRLWDVASGRELRTFDGHTDRISSVAFSPDGRQALSASWDQTIRLWDVARGKELRRLAGHAGWVTSAVFSPDGKSVLSGAYDRTVRLWDAATGRERRRLEGHTREVYSVAFSLDGERALSGGNDRTVRLWDIATGAELRRFEGHANAVIQVAFTPDGRRILSGSSLYQHADNAVRLWDAESGKQLCTLGGYTGGVWSIAFSADGTRVLSANSDRTLRLRRMAP